MSCRQGWDALVDDLGLFRDTVEAIKFHNDAGCIPNKKGAVVKRRARWMAAWLRTGTIKEGID